MPDVDDEQDGSPSPFTPLHFELAKMRGSNLTAAIDDVDKIIGILEEKKEQITQSMGLPASSIKTGPNQTPEPDSIPIVMTRLQNPVKTRLDSITNDLKEVNKAQKNFGKALDKVGD